MLLGSIHKIQTLLFSLTKLLLTLLQLYNLPSQKTKSSAILRMNLSCVNGFLGYCFTFAQFYSRADRFAALFYFDGDLAFFHSNSNNTPMHHALLDDC